MVKGLLKILGGGFVVFMLLAIADEWAFFAGAWFGDGEQSVAELSEAEQKAAADTVHLTLNLMRHLYVSGGDLRFADRMPASDGVKEEMLADIVYLGQRHLVEDPELLRLDVMSVEVLAEDRLELRTRELWRFRVMRADGAGEVEPPQNRTVEGAYLVERGGSGWRVESWRLLQPGASSGSAGG
jgi:hypothetical protein